MKTIITAVVIALIIVVTIPILAYKFVFSGSPRDLGVKYTEADQATAYANNGVDSVAITPAADNSSGIKYEGQKEVKTSFTSAEISALNNSVKWANYPVHISK